MLMRRILAFVMALILTFSTFGSASITGYASPANGADVEMVTVTEEGMEESSVDVAEEEDVIITESSEEIETESAEESSIEEVMAEETFVKGETKELLENSVSSASVSLDELEYSGYRSEDTLSIHELDMCAVMDFTAENIQTILTAWNGNFEGNLYIDYPDDGYITEGVWNAAKELLGSEGYVHFNVNPEGEPGQTWMFYSPSTASGQTNIDVTCNAGENGEGWTCSFDNVSFNAESAGINLAVSANSERTCELYEAYRTALLADNGDESSSFVLLDSNGNELDEMSVIPVVEDEYCNVSVYDISQLTANTTYTIKMKNSYSGILNEFNDNGYTKRELVLHPSYIGKESFTADDVDEIMANHDEASLDVITIVTAVEDMSGSIKKEVVNAVLPYLKESTSERTSSVNISFMNSETQSGVAWVLENPQEQTADQTLTCSFSIVDGVAQFVLGEHSLKADNININFYRDNEFDSEGAIEWQSIFGGKDAELKIGSTNVYAKYVLSVRNTSVFICNIQMLEPNTAYSVIKPLYMGRVDTWEDGTKELLLLPEEAGEEYFTTQHLLAILAAHAGNTYDYVYIAQPSDINAETGAVNGTVNGAVINAAAGLLTKQEGKDSAVKFGFNDGESGRCQDLCIINPHGNESETDIAVSSSFSVSQNEIYPENPYDGHPIVTIDLPEFDSDRVDMWFGIDKTSDEGQILTDLFGQNERKLEIEGTNTWVDYNVDDNNVCFYVGDISTLNKYVGYEITEYVYKGEVDEWKDENDEIRRILNICASHLDKENLTEQEILNAIALRAAMGQSFDEVYIENGYTENASISGAVFNAATELVFSLTEVVAFGYSDDEKWIRWNFVNSTGTEDENIDVSAYISVPENAASADNVVVCKTINDSLAGTGWVELQYGFMNSTVQADVLHARFGDGESMLHIGEEQGSAVYFRNDDCTMITVRNAFFGDNGEEYPLSDATYNGSVDFEGDDKVLYIDWHQFEYILDEWSVEAIVDIFKGYKEYGVTFDIIEIKLPGESRSDVTIYSKIYNAAVGLLSNNNKGIRYINDMVDYSIQYHFVNPGTAKLSADVHMKNEMYINGYDRPSLKFDLPTALSKVRTNVYMELSLEDEITQEYMMRMGDGTENNRYVLSPTELDLISPIWQAIYAGEADDEQRVGIEFGLTGIEQLKKDKEYVINSRLFGYTGEYIWDKGTPNERLVRVLEINANEYGFETFSAKVLYDILDLWKIEIEGKDELPFNVVRIQQTATDSNVISKDDFNLARELLVENGDRQINFVFDSSVSEQVGDTDKWNWYQDQVEWSFNDPSEATADMKVDLTITPKGEDGLKLKVAKNTYPASGVNVNYSVDAELEMAKLFSWAIGDAPEPGENYREHGIVTDLSKLTLANCEAWYGSYINGENRQVMSYSIDNVQNLPATECTSASICHGEEFYIGQEGLNLSPNQVEKPGTKVTWKSFDTNIGTFKDSTLTLINEGRFRYAASFQNTNGVQVAEIFEADVTAKLLDMDFVNTDKTVSGNNVLTIEMNSSDRKYKDEDETIIKDDWYPCAYLDLRFYPDRAGLEPSRLDWIVVGDEGVIELIENNEYEGEYYPSGEFKALKPGKVKIMVGANDEEGNPLKDATGDYLVAECEIIVEPSVHDEIDWDTAFEEVPPVVITNYDKTLADVKLPAEFAWKVPSTSLASFTNVEYYDFPAIYTSPKDGRTAEVMVGLRFITIEGITLGAGIQMETDQGTEWVELAPGAAVGDGVEIQFMYSLDIWNADFTLEDLNYLLDVKDKNIELSLAYDKQITIDENGTHFIASSAASGKKTFTVSLMQTDTSKANAKSTAIKKGSCSVTVVKKPIANFGEMYIGKTVDESTAAFAGMIGEKGTFYFGLPKDSGFKLTVKNLNTAVSKWGKITYKDMVVGECTYYVACVPYEIIGEGNVAYSLTANDEVKTSESRTAPEYYRDYLPRIQTTKLTIDKNWEDALAGIPIQMDGDTWFGDSNSGTISFETDKFNIVLGNEDDNEIVVVSIKEGVDVKKGTYKLSVDVPVTAQLKDNNDLVIGEKEVTWPLSLTVTVTDKLPTLTVKQTEKVNLFYTDAEGDGAFTIIANADITDVELKPQKDDDDLDYTLESQGDGTYTVKQLPGTSGSNKKATIVASFAGYTKKVEKKITIATVNKAPTLVLSSKSDTYYTNYSKGDDLNTYLTFTDKSTGEPFEDISDVMVADTTGNTELPSNQGSLYSFKAKANKNTYALGKDENGISIVLENAQNAVKATDKFTFYVKEANWASPIKVSYSIKVDTTIPKLELSSKSITINKNDAIYAQQVGITQLSLKGSDRDVSTRDYRVSFSGTDTKSNQYLNTDLILERHNGNLRVRLNKNTIPKGTYKYNVNLSAEGLPNVTTQLTVKVVDEKPAKCITVTGKGSIDVLDRDGTSVTYTAKLKNVQGSVVHAEIRGTDANMFYSVYEDGKLIVKAHEGAGYSTKHTYKITPVFYVKGDDFGEFELEGKEQSIKVKQGKPKLTLTADISNILYRNRDNQVVMNVDALLNKTEHVKVTSIEPLNYWGTFEYMTSDIDGDIQNVIISECGDPQEVIATGKTVTLQFNVYYEGMAVNEKPIKATFKMVVK